jgi:adenine-specific DNA methylase
MNELQGSPEFKALTDEQRATYRGFREVACTALAHKLQIDTRSSVG